MKKKSPVKDAIEQFVRNILDEHDQMEGTELGNAVVKAGFNQYTYEDARASFEWIESRKDAENKTYYFVREKQTPAPPSHQPSLSLPSIVLRALDKNDTIRMLHTIGTADPLLRHLLDLLEADNFEDAEQEGYDKGFEKALEEVKDCINEIEGSLDANPLIKSAFDELLHKIKQLRSA